MSLDSETFSFSFGVIIAASNLLISVKIEVGFEYCDGELVLFDNLSFSQSHRHLIHRDEMIPGSSPCSPSLLNL